jgi:hypothetical protein
MNVDFDIKDAFLVGACRMGHGDIKKMIKVVEVCKAMRLSLTDEEIESQILSQLRIEDSMKDGVMITRKGYYYAIKISQVQRILEWSHSMKPESYRSAPYSMFVSSRMLGKLNQGSTFWKLIMVVVREDLILTERRSFN